MGASSITARRPRRGLPSALTGVAVFAFVAALALLWAKWLPYGGKLHDVAQSHRWSGGIVLDLAGAPGASPSVSRAWSFLKEYFGDVWKAYLAGLVIAAALESLVPSGWLFRAMGSRDGLKGSLTGGLVGIPSLMCTACAAPVAAGMRRHGAQPSATLAYAIGSPVLNPAVIAFIAILGPWQWVATRIGVGLVLVFGLTALVARAAPATPPAPAPPASDFDLSAAPRRFIDRFVSLAVTLTPIYIGVMVLLGLFRGWLFPLDAHTAGAIALLVAVVLGTLIDLPTAGEVPLLLALAAGGLSTGAIGALLLTLPAISIVTMAMLAPTHTVRVTVAAAGAVALSGLAAAGLLGLLTAV